MKPAVSKARFWVGWIVSVFPALFLLLDGVMKLIKPPVVVEATVKLGYAEAMILPLGLVLLTCTVLYLVPATAGLGAILITGYLGGAVATHVRVGDPAFAIFFPIILGALVWGGRYLRERRLSAIVPLLRSGD